MRTGSLSGYDPVDVLIEKGTAQQLPEDILTNTLSREIYYVVPPGLRNAMDHFKYYYKIASKNRMPIMICGPSGVGKSLFLHLYKKFYELDNKNHKEYKPPITINCSHFTGEMSRSELFGHKKGAFTGAVKDHDGWLKKAKDGTLILEEIGDLPKETQAMLLTYIETGKYHKVGSTEEETSNAQIVGATNREEALRRDFQYRFFPFYIPPLYERRRDILYYLSVKFPKLIPKLKPFEILALLTYNWPGNVRELERIGNLLELRTSYGKYDVTSKVRLSALEKIGREYTDLEIEKIFALYVTLKKSGINIDKLEKYLNRGYIGISPYTNKNYMNNFNTGKLFFMKEYYENFNVYELLQSFWLEQVYENGLIRFCSLFYQDFEANKNLLDVNEGPYYFVPNDIIPEIMYNNVMKDKDFPVLEKKIFQYMSGIDLPRNSKYIPTDMEERIQFFQKQAQSHPESPLFASFKKTGRKTQNDNNQDIWLKTKKEILKEYYTGLLKKTAGNEAAAARIAGENYRTFRDNIRRAGVKP